MKIAAWQTLVDHGERSKTAQYEQARRDLEDAIAEVDWPTDSGAFTVYPEFGKKRIKSPTKCDGIGYCLGLLGGAGTFVTSS